MRLALISVFRASYSNTDITKVVAWIGAVTGATGLIWDYYKWRRSRPRISVVAEYSEPMLVSTGRKTEDGFHIVESVPWHLIEVTITNIGGEATTVRSVTLVSYDSWLTRWRRRPSFLNAYGLKNETLPLPQKLDVGEQWRGEIARNDVASGLRDVTRLWCHVYHSWSRVPLDVKVVPPAKHLP